MSNLIANLFEKGISPFAAEFPEVKIQRQIVDHYLRGICTLTQQYGIYTIELQSPSKFHGKYLLQTDDVDIEFSKVFEVIDLLQGTKSIFGTLYGVWGDDFHKKFQIKKKIHFILFLLIFYVTTAAP